MKKYFLWLLALTVLCSCLFLVLPVQAEAASDKPIPRVDIFIDTPELGQKPDYQYNILRTQVGQYRFCEEEGYKMGVLWQGRDLTVYDIDPDEDYVFKAGRRGYLFNLLLKPLAGYTFTEDTVVKVNNQTAHWEFRDAGDGSIAILYWFDVPGTLLETVNVSLAAPVAGEAPSYTPTCAPNSRISFCRWDDTNKKIMSWYDVTGGFQKKIDPDSGYLFEPGHTYKAIICISPDPGYYLASNGSTSGYLNGEKMTYTGMDNKPDRLTYTFSYTFPATEKTTVSKISIKGIQTPVAGESPDYACSWTSTAKYRVDTTFPGTNYKIGVLWEDLTEGRALDPNTDKFQQGHIYKVSMVVKTKGSGVFGTCSATLNGNNAQCGNIAGYDNQYYRQISYTFGETQGALLTALTINGIDSPVVGKTPDYSASVPGGTPHYEIDTAVNTMTVKNGISWLNVTDNEMMYPEDTFEAGKQYRVFVNLIATDGARFDTIPPADVTCTISGREASNTRLSSGNKLKMYATFDVLEHPVVSCVELTDLTVPEIGASFDAEVSVPAGAFYEVDRISWYDSTTAFSYAASPFRAGHSYEVCIVLKPLHGAKFASDWTATVDGVTAKECRTSTVKNEYYVDLAFDPLTVEVDKIDVTGIHVPADGGKPDTEFTLSQPDLYTVTDVLWRDEATRGEVKADDTFEKGNAYSVTIYLEAKDGVTFQNDGTTTSVAATLDGKTAYTSRILGEDVGKKICVVYYFDAIPTAYIYTAPVLIDEPEAGEAPDYDPVIPGIQDYELDTATGQPDSLNGVRWYDVTDAVNVDPNTGVFQPGHQYRVYISLKTKGGAVFSTTEGGALKTAFTISGNAADGYFREGTTASVDSKFTFDKLPGKGTDVRFTSDSLMVQGNNVTVDIETMAEADEALMAEYLDDKVSYQWYRNGIILVGETAQALKLERTWAGDVIYVKVSYGDKISVSQEFQVADKCAVHTFSEWANTTAPTCTNQGFQERTCSVCGHTETQTVPPVGHTESGWKSDADNHWKECTAAGCGVEISGSKAAHDFGSDNVCDTCGYDKTVIHTHSLTKVDAAAPKCLDAGHKEYYTCDCGEWFEDAAGTTVITDKTSVTIPALGHTPSGWKNNSTEHWKVCTVCDTQIISTLKLHNYGEDDACDECGFVQPHVHSITQIPEMTASCDSAGHKNYYICSGCGKWFSDAAATVEITDHSSVVVPATGHTESGWKQDGDNHWKDCTVCSATLEATKAAHNYGGDDACDDCGYVKPHVHTLTLVPEVAPTCTDKGTREHHSCTCGKLYEDAAATLEITDPGTLEIPNTGHTESGWSKDDTEHWKSCTVCSVTTVKTAHNYGSDNLCDDCGYDKTVPHTHTLTAVSAKAPTCTAEGNKEYHTCECGKWFEDAAGTLEILDKNSVVLPAAGHTESGWKKDDTHHCKECTVCGCDIPGSKAAHEYGADTICDTCGFDNTVLHVHSLTAVAEQVPTCTAAGNKGYYTCGCGKWFSDAAAEHEITNKSSVILPAAGHTESEWKKDTVEHWKECTTCGSGIPGSRDSHEFGMDNVCDTCGYDQTVVHTHSLTEVSAKTPTCTAEGNKAYYTCDCGSWFEDAAGTVEIGDKNSVKIPAAGHTESGWKNDETNHWKVCTVCASLIPGSEAAHNYGSDNICDDCGHDKTVIHTHSLSEIAAVAPTCTLPGNKTYYTCDCGKWFQDGAGTTEITDKNFVVILPLGHTESGWKNDETDHWKECAVCSQVIGKAAHDYGSDNVCDSCGYEKSAAANEIVRIYGDNRFLTAFKVADEMKANLGIEKFDAVIVASGLNFADALSGSYLAAVKNAPILLSFNDKYNDMAKDYIRNNLKSGGTVYILGGEKAVPTSMEEGLTGFTVKRLAGADRFGTNLEILKEAGVGDKPILVCTGISFADSLSASASELPILLVWRNLTDAQKAFLGSLSGNKLYVIGGESAVDAGMADQVAAYGTTERVGGANRFETSVAIAKKFFPNPDSAVLAYAWNYPDGLCGGALASTMDAPLILTMTKYEAAAEAYVQGETIGSGAVLGGTGLISDPSVRSIFRMPAAQEILVR